MKEQNEMLELDLKTFNSNACISSCIPTCEKAIRYIKKMKSQMQFNGSDKTLNDYFSIENACTVREINLEQVMLKDNFFRERNRISKNLPIKSIHASNYLNTAEPFILNLVSKENFNEIINIARLFPGNLTSFLGFECRLGNLDARADWAFAISGLNGDRYVLENLLNESYLPSQILEKNEWRQIRDFAKAWADVESVLNDKVQCFWIEFDMPEDSPDIPIPCVFFGPNKIPEGHSVNDFQNYEWLTKMALPILRGQPLSKAIESNLKNCINRIPKNATLFQVGTLLSRSENGVRMYINKINPKEVVTYLNSIGWFDETGKFAQILKEIKNLAERFVVSFDVNEDGIGPKVGIELSFASKDFQKETRWAKLLDYLVKKDLCLSIKKDAILKYQGSEKEFSGGIMEPIKAASDNITNIFSSAIVRYISHIKIVYQADELLEAKAYPAVRLFEKSNNI